PESDGTVSASASTALACSALLVKLTARFQTGSSDSASASGGSSSAAVAPVGALSLGTASLGLRRNEISFFQIEAGFALSSAPPSEASSSDCSSGSGFGFDLRPNEISFFQIDFSSIASSRRGA